MSVLTVLFAPINLVGPINASIGMAEVLKRCGHRVVFAVRSDWKGRLECLGFEEKIIDHGDGDDRYAGQGSAERNVIEIETMLGPESRLDKMKNLTKIFLEHGTQEMIAEQPLLDQIVSEVRPDLILVDHVVWSPALMGVGIPWVLVMTCNPLAFDFAFDTKLPPSGLGLPTDGDPEKWKRIKQELEQDQFPHWNKYNDWLVSIGQEPLQRCKFIRPSPYLNIYMFPEELDYTDLVPWPSNFVRFDNFKRSGAEEVFQVPEKLRTGSGKLIFLSMGSMGSGNVELMKRLVAILSECEHRFIVSKGALGHSYELADNMYGQNYLPQIKALQAVDLVITHGGNNTYTEALYYGKPVVVMPMFFDQFDNCQRIVEKGFGIQVDPYHCTGAQLIRAIDDVLADQPMLDRVRKASDRIRRDNCIDKITKLLEHTVERHRCSST